MNFLKRFSTRNDGKFEQSNPVAGVYLQAYGASAPVKSSSNNKNLEEGGEEEEINETTEIQDSNNENGVNASSSAVESTNNGNGNDNGANTDINGNINVDINGNGNDDGDVDEKSEKKNQINQSNSNSNSNVRSTINAQPINVDINNVIKKSTLDSPANAETPSSPGANSARMKKMIEDYNNRRRTITQMIQERDNNEKKKEKEKETEEEVQARTQKWKQYTSPEYSTTNIENGNDGSDGNKKEKVDEEWHAFIREQEEKMKKNIPYWDVVGQNAGTTAMDNNQLRQERRLLYQMTLWIENYGVPALQQGEEVENLKKQLLQSNEDANQLEKECVDMAAQMENNEQEIQKLQQQLDQLKNNSRKNEQDLNSSTTEINKLKKEVKQWKEKYESVETQNKRLENEVTRMKDLLDTLRGNSGGRPSKTQSKRVGTGKVSHGTEEKEREAESPMDKAMKSTPEKSSGIVTEDEEYVAIEAEIDEYENSEDEWIDDNREISNNSSKKQLTSVDQSNNNSTDSYDIKNKNKNNNNNNNNKMQPPTNNSELDNLIGRARIKSIQINKKTEEEKEVNNNNNDTKTEQKKKGRFGGLLSRFQKFSKQPVPEPEIKTIAKLSPTPSNEIKVEVLKNVEDNKKSLKSADNIPITDVVEVSKTKLSKAPDKTIADNEEKSTVIAIVTRTKQYYLNPTTTGNVRLLSTNILSANVVSRKPKYFGILDALPSSTKAEKRPAFLMNTKNDPLVPCLCLFVNQGQYERFKAEVKAHGVRSIPFQDAFATFAIAILHMDEAVTGKDPSPCMNFLKQNGHTVETIPEMMPSSLFIATKDGQLHHLQMDSDELRDSWLIHIDTMNRKRTVSVAQRKADTTKINRNPPTGVYKYQY